MIGRPEPNSAPSMIRPCAALLFGSACAVTARSKRRASRPNRSPAPPIEAVSLQFSDRDAGALRRRLEARDRRVGGAVARHPLHVDDVGWDAAHHARRHHRLVGEGDAARMRAERLGDRDRVLRRHVTRLAEAEIDDQVLDHAPCSRRSRPGWRSAVQDVRQCIISGPAAPRPSPCICRRARGRSLDRDQLRASGVSTSCCRPP